MSAAVIESSPVQAPGGEQAPLDARAWPPGVTSTLAIFAEMTGAKSSVKAVQLYRDTVRMYADRAAQGDEEAKQALSCFVPVSRVMADDALAAELGISEVMAKAFAEELNEDVADDSFYQRLQGRSAQDPEVRKAVRQGDYLSLHQAGFEDEAQAIMQELTQPLTEAIGSHQDKSLRALVRNIIHRGFMEASGLTEFYRKHGNAVRMGSAATAAVVGFAINYASHRYLGQSLLDDLGVPDYHLPWQGDDAPLAEHEPTSEITMEDGQPLELPNELTVKDGHIWFEGESVAELPSDGDVTLSRQQIDELVAELREHGITTEIVANAETEPQKLYAEPLQIDHREWFTGGENSLKVTTDDTYVTVSFQHEGMVRFNGQEFDPSTTPLKVAVTDRTAHTFELPLENGEVKVLRHTKLGEMLQEGTAARVEVVHLRPLEGEMTAQVLATDLGSGTGRLPSHPVFNEIEGAPAGHSLEIKGLPVDEASGARTMLVTTAGVAAVTAGAAGFEVRRRNVHREALARRNAAVDRVVDEALTHIAARAGHLTRHPDELAKIIQTFLQAEDIAAAPQPVEYAYHFVEKLQSELGLPVGVSIANGNVQLWPKPTAVMLQEWHDDRQLLQERLEKDYSKQRGLSALAEVTGQDIERWLRQGNSKERERRLKRFMYDLYSEVPEETFWRILQHAGLHHNADVHEVYSDQRGIFVPSFQIEHITDRLGDVLATQPPRRLVA